MSLSGTSKVFDQMECVSHGLALGALQDWCRLGHSVYTAAKFSRCFGSFRDRETKYLDTILFATERCMALRDGLVMHN